MTNNTPIGTKKHRESTKPESHQMPKMFFLLLLLLQSSSSDRLVQICVTLSWWFSHKTEAFSTEQCTSLLVYFYRFEVLRGGSNCSPKNYGFLCDAIFFFTCMNAHKSLSHQPSLFTIPSAMWRLMANCLPHLLSSEAYSRDLFCHRSYSSLSWTHC